MSFFKVICTDVAAVLVFVQVSVRIYLLEVVCTTVVPNATMGSVMDEVQGSVQDRGLLTESDEAWERAVRVAAVIGPLAVLPRLDRDRVKSAAAQLGISRRQFYVLLSRWREGEGLISDLLPARSRGGHGRTYLPDAVEAVITESIRKGFRLRAS